MPGTYPRGSRFASSEGRYSVDDHIDARAEAGPRPEAALEVITSYCIAWLAGDTLAILALYHPDLTLHWPGRHRLAGTHEGQEAAVEALLGLQAATNREPLEIVDVLAGDHGVMVVAREHWRRTDGTAPESIKILRGLHYVVGDGHLRECRVFEFDQPAIDD